MSHSENLVVVPISGEQLDIASVAGARRGLVLVTDLRRQLTELSNLCRETLISEADRRGQLSWVDEDGTKIRIGGAGLEEEYDAAVLAELRDAGLPDERWNQLVSWKPKVDGRVINQLRRNPEYAAIIDRAVTETKEKYRGIRFE
jgi:hypothetical protein